MGVTGPDSYSKLSGGGVPLSSPAAPTPDVSVPPSGVGNERMAGAFEGADRTNSAIALWAPPIQSVDADILPEKPVIDGRARDLLRNDAYIQGGVTLRKDNIVGAHYLLNARPASRVVRGTQDDKWEEEFQEEVEEKWELYADSPDSWTDAARTNRFTELVRLAVGIHMASGEVLATAEWIKDDGAPFSTAVQMVDLDRLSDPMDFKRNWAFDPNQRAGIRYNKRGAPLAYFIRTAHPNDYGPVAFELPEWKEVKRIKYHSDGRPWGRLQVIHLFEQLRPDQSRGLTEMAAALKPTKLTHNWRDINIQHALTQSMYAATITSELPTEQVFAQLGGNNLTPEAIQAAVEAAAQGYMGAVLKYAGKANGLQIDGVKIPHLFPNTKLDMVSPGQGGPLGQEFEQSLLRYMAAALGVSYEQLSRDYTHTNYSSARAAMNETWKAMQAQKKLIADRFASILYRLWLEEAINKNEIAALPARQAGRLYTGGRLNLAFDALTRCEWIGASRGQIDEAKETDAAIARITAGLSTAEDELARLGKDWRKVFRQIKREQDMRKALGLVLPGLESKAAPKPGDDSADDRPADTRKKEAA